MGAGKSLQGPIFERRRGVQVLEVSNGLLILLYAHPDFVCVSLMTRVLHAQVALALLED